MEPCAFHPALGCVTADGTRSLCPAPWAAREVPFLLRCSWISDLMTAHAEGKMPPPEVRKELL